MKLFYNLFAAGAAAFLLFGCSNQQPTQIAVGPHAEVQNENDLFLQQKSFDPWLLSTSDPTHKVPAFIGTGSQGQLHDGSGQNLQTFYAKQYDNGMIHSTGVSGIGLTLSGGGAYSQSLNLQTGVLQTTYGNYSLKYSLYSQPWPQFWQKSDIAIDGDPEAQQVTHAELFYLCSSVGPDRSSIPPMGLSSNVYDGHIFWDAEIWMLPALLPQHPELARSIIDYRFDRLADAKELAKLHGYAGAEFPWESASTGREEAPLEFSYERHITADIALAAWQYYLWTGDKTYLSEEGWPLLQGNAEYWSSRAKLGKDGYYHITNVIGPDETAGQVSDDAWTNGVVQFTLRAAAQAAAIIGNSTSSKWTTIANKLLIPYDKQSQLYLQFPTMDRRSQQAKQADTQMLIYPLGYPMSPAAESNTLDYYRKHTIAYGPAMTSSINAIVAAKLGRAKQSLDLYRDSYRPFMRGPWDAFSEKRTKSDVYFCTGMGGCLQAVLYGFAGLNVAASNSAGSGVLISKSGDSALYANPHLPPGWSGLTIKGVQFCGKSYDLTVSAGDKVRVSPAGR